MNDCELSVGLAYKREKEKTILKDIYLFIYLNNNVPYQVYQITYPVITINDF